MNELEQSVIDPLAEYSLPSTPSSPAQVRTERYGQRRSSPYKPKIDGPFIRGPIPMNWVHKAIHLPGQCLGIGLVLFYYCGLRKSNRVKVGINDIKEQIGFSWDTIRRGLLALEEAGLIEVERHPGCKPIITVLSLPSAA